jgi:hypothetical protein
LRIVYLEQTKDHGPAELFPSLIRAAQPGNVDFLNDPLPDYRVMKQVVGGGPFRQLFEGVKCPVGRSYLEVERMRQHRIAIGV